MKKRDWKWMGSWWPFKPIRTVVVDPAVGQDVTATAVFDTTGHTLVMVSSEVKTAEEHNDQ